MEDRNDPLVQKMRRYINAFSKDGEISGNHPEHSNLTESNMNKTVRKPRKCWHLIRQSIECEKEENVDCPDFKYI